MTKSPTTIALRDMWKDRTVKAYDARYYNPTPKVPSKRDLHRQEVKRRLGKS